jgi:hypothetical protein
MVICNLYYIQSSQMFFGGAGSIDNPGGNLIANLLSFQPEMGLNNVGKCT